MKPNVVFIGKMASGKSHAAKFLIEKYGYTHLSLADPIRVIEKYFEETNNGETTGFSDKLWIALGSGQIINNEQFWHFHSAMLKEVSEIPVEFPKPRRRLQHIGTEIGRKQIDPDLWIKIALHTVKSNPDIHYVCDDVRFLNEYEAFTNENFIGLKLNVSPETQMERLEVLYNMTFEQVKQALAHDSEQEIDYIPAPPEHHVNADQSLVKMYKEIEQTLGLV